MLKTNIIYCEGNSQPSRLPRLLLCNFPIPRDGVSQPQQLTGDFNSQNPPLSMLRVEALLSEAGEQGLNATKGGISSSASPPLLLTASPAGSESTRFSS